MMDFKIYVIWLLQYYFALVFGDKNEYKLVNDLLRRYDKRIRPSRNATHALNVTFGLALSQIIDVDEKNQILTTNCWLNQMWTDYGLRWDPKKYGGIKVVRLPYEAVWKPDIFLYNNADVSTMFSSISSNVIVSSDGNITWLSMVIFKSSCSINVRFFPFDEQNCSMTFASWTYDGFQLNLLLTTNEGDISNYIPNSEWTLMKLYVEKKVMYYSCCIEPYPDITYYIYIRRRPLFYIFNMVLPCILITLVALLGFYIPSDSGEKVTMGITTLLSMTVFMMLVAENMPPTSNVLPLIAFRGIFYIGFVISQIDLQSYFYGYSEPRTLCTVTVQIKIQKIKQEGATKMKSGGSIGSITGIYYGITICIVSFATGMTVFTLNIHHKGHRGRPVPPILKKIFFGVFAKILCLKIDVAEAPLSKVTYTPDVAKRGSGPIAFKLTTDEQSVKHANVKSKQRIFLDQHPMNRYQVRLDSSKQNNNSQLPTNVHSPNGLHTLQNIDSNNTDQFEQNFSKVMNKVYGAIENNESRIAQQDKRDAIKLEWQQVALVVDRILLSLFVTVTLTMTCAILIQGPVSQT